MRPTGISICVGAWAICSGAWAAPCEVSPKDKDAVAQAVQGFFDALATGERAALATTTTADFYAYDVGKRFTGPTLADAIAEAKAASSVPKWSLGPIDVHLDCQIAWAAWINTGSSSPGTCSRP